MNIFPLRLCGFLAAGLIAMPAFADVSSSIEERLRRLEEEVSALRAQNERLKAGLPAEAPAPAVVAQPVATVIKPSGKLKSVTLGGFIQAHAEFLDKGDSRFTAANNRLYVRRARLVMAGRFQSDFDFKVDAEFAGSLGDASGYRAQMADGYVTWTRHSAANVRIGQFKTPFGYEQLANDLTLAIIERSLANDRLTLNRQVGAQVAGEFFDKRLSYATGIFNGMGVNSNINDNDSFLWAGRVSGVPLHTEVDGVPLRWTVGAGAYASKDTRVSLEDCGFSGNTFKGQREGFGIDTQLSFGAFEFWTEYLRTQFKPESDLPADSFFADGWHAQAAYTFVPNYWQGAIRFESFDPNTSIKGNSTDTWILGLNYFFGGDSVKLMMDYFLFNADSQPDQRQKVLVRLQTVF